MNTPWASLTAEERLAVRINRWRQLVPSLTCLLALFVMSAPIVTSMPSMPHLALLTVLVWGLFQPVLMPPHVALLLGVVTDAALGLPLGINAVLMPAMAVAVAALERRYRHRPYSVDWALAALLVLAYQFFGWQLLRFVGGDPSFGPLLWQAGTTVLAYPLVVAILARIQRGWGDDA